MFLRLVERLRWRCGSSRLRAVVRELLLQLFEGRSLFVRGHAVSLVSPVAEVYQLATLGAERAVRVIFQVNGLFAVRTLHHE
jgi:hypothetical protein